MDNQENNLMESNKKWPIKLCVLYFSLITKLVAIISLVIILFKINFLWWMIILLLIMVILLAIKVIFLFFQILAKQIQLIKLIKKIVIGDYALLILFLLLSFLIYIVINGVDYNFYGIYLTLYSVVILLISTIIELFFYKEKENNKEPVKVHLISIGSTIIIIYLIFSILEFLFGISVMPDKFSLRYQIINSIFPESCLSIPKGYDATPCTNYHEFNKDFFENIGDSLTNQYSWDTSVGRIYADQCSGPPYSDSGKFIKHANAIVVDPCMGRCLDGGTSFYNAYGGLIAGCGSWGGSYDSICTWLGELKSGDADYKNINYSCND